MHHYNFNEEEDTLKKRVNRLIKVAKEDEVGRTYIFRYSLLLNNIQWSSKTNEQIVEYINTCSGNTVVAQTEAEYDFSIRKRRLHEN